MAHLAKPQKYDLQDSNIALLGSDLEKHVREEAGDKEPAWETAGQEPGTQIWRIEQFTVKEWPKDRFGHFFDGDSYIILHTYKKTPESQDLAFDLHFWLGSETSQDEAGTAAYKTVELDDHLGGAPVQYREVQGYESARLLSYFPRFVSLAGGAASGFRHVTAPPPPDTRRLFRISAGRAGVTTLQVREVPAEGASVVQGDVFVLDMGDRIWQLNTRASVGKERFKAAEFVQSLVADADREGLAQTTVYDEGGGGAGRFLEELGLESVPDAPAVALAEVKQLFRLSDASGRAVVEPVSPVALSSLTPDDAFILDDSANRSAPSVYVWVGSNASLQERRLALQYGQWYLYEHHKSDEKSAYAVSIVKMAEGRETQAFLGAIGDQ